MKASYITDHLVAFIDILGFSKKVLSIKDEKELRAIHKTISSLHDTFSKNPRDSFEEHEREISKRTVLALSDALVISTAFKSPISKTVGIFDNLCSEIYTLGMNQAICAANGIFLRGGVSKGQFFFQDDVLVSQAMVRAYKLENEGVRYPVICLDDVTYNFFASHPDNFFYAEEIMPRNNLFKNYQLGGETKNCVDYIRIGIGAAYDEFTSDDKKEWLKTPPEKRDEIREDIAKQHAMNFLHHHKKAIERELKAHRGESGILEKYVWLSGYHNEVAGEWFPGDVSCLIDLPSAEWV